MPTADLPWTEPLPSSAQVLGQFPHFLRVPPLHCYTLHTWLSSNSQHSLITLLKNHEHLHLLYSFVNVSLPLKIDLRMPQGRGVSILPFCHLPSLSPHPSLRKHLTQTSLLCRRPIDSTPQMWSLHPDISMELNVSKPPSPQLATLREWSE